MTNPVDIYIDLLRRKGYNIPQDYMKVGRELCEELLTEEEPYEMD